jgi:hypothetical protein
MCILKKTHVLCYTQRLAPKPCSWNVFVFVRILDHVFTDTHENSACL